MKRFSLLLGFGLGLIASSQGAGLIHGSLPVQPLRFEPNAGPSASEFPYVAAGPGYRLALKSDGHLLMLSNPQNQRSASLRTHLLGTRRDAPVQAIEPLPTRTSYLLGSDPGQWRRDVPTYARVRTNGVYPGIDLIFYGGAGTLEYDFVLAPAADPSVIRFSIEGAESVTTDATGDLLLTTLAGPVRWRRPVAYQEIAGQRRGVEVAYRIVADGTVDFELGRFQRSLPLVIDPQLNYSTFLGARGNEVARAIGSDAAGNAYVAGVTSSNNLPVTAGVVQPQYGGDTFDNYTGDVFVAKFSPAGALLYLTYLGGAADDIPTAIAVDAAGNAYVTGYTNSTGFPVSASALQKTFGGFGGNVCNRFGDAFVAKLNPSGTQLLYSTFLGGDKDDSASAIAIDAAGNAYITGAALSQNFPVTTGAYKTTWAGRGGEPARPSCNDLPLFSSGDGFVAKLNPTGSQLVFSTYFGGVMDDMPTAIALDPARNVYVAGATLSQNFPTTTGAVRTIYAGSEQQNEFFNVGDGFVTKLNDTGSALVYSTYLGNTGDDIIFAMTVDAGGSAYVAGSTSSRSFPTTSGAIQRTYRGYLELPFLIEQLWGDAFVTRLNPTGTGVLYSTYLGGANNDMALAIAVDSGGLIYLAGATGSLDFPVTTDAIQRSLRGTGGQGEYTDVGDAFLAIIDPNSPTLKYGTYLGGLLDDVFLGMTFAPDHSLWIAGNTLSSDFPVTSGTATQATYGGAKAVDFWKGDMVLARITELPVVAITGPTILTDGTGIINGATYKSGDIVSGSWVSLKGTGFTDKTVDWSKENFSSGRLPTTLNGDQVLFNGQPGSIWYLIDGNPQQINVQAPANLSGPVTVQVVRNGVPGNTVISSAVASAPGLFPYSVDGGKTFYAASVFPDGTVVGDPASAPGTRKARAGDRVSLYANSLAVSPAGLVNVSGATGPVTVKVGTITVSADFSGLVSPGLFQVNFTVPAQATSGNYQISIAIDNNSSQANILLPYTN